MTAHQPALKIVWYELTGFGAILAISWVNELAGLSRMLFGGGYAPHWQDAAGESVIIIAVAIPTILSSYRLSKRLHYLEGLLRVCAWCRKIGQDDQWVPIEKFVQDRLNTETSHGICPNCIHREIVKIR